MNVVRKVARNISYLFAYQAMSRFLGLVLNLVLARRLTDAGYGRYSLILVIVMMAAMAADFGTASIVVREISCRRERANSLLAPVLLLRLITTVLVAAGVFLTVILGDIERGFALPLMIAALSIIPASLATALEAGLQAHERMDLSALADVVFSVVLTAAGVIVVYMGGGVTAMIIVYLAASGVRLLYSLAAYRLLDERIRGGWHFSGADFRHMTLESFPVLCWQLVSLAYYKVDVLLLGMFRTEAEVGWYAAAYKLFEVPIMFGWLAVQALLPLMSRLYQTSHDGLVLLFEKTIKYIWIVGLGVAVLMAALSRPVVELLLPAEYEPAARLLIVLGASLPFMVGCVLFGNLFIAMDVQARMARWSLASLAVNVGLNLVLIRQYGVMGAAITTLVSEIFSFLLFYGFTAHFLRHVKMVEVFLAPVLAAAGVLLLLVVAEHYSSPLAGLAGIVIYPLVLYFSGVISRDDLGYFRQLKTGGKTGGF